MTMHKALHPGDDVDRLYLPKNKEEEDLPALKIGLMPRYNDLKISEKSRKEN